MWLRQSTASQEILLGKFLDSTDGNTAETGLTIANTDIKLWKEGATTLANKNSGGATHISGGDYYAVLDATDSNTLGKLEVNVHVAGALAVRREFMVVPAMIYDSLILGSDDLDTNVIKIADTTQTANDNGADINTILSRVIGTLESGSHNPASAAQIAVLTDWINGGRLDLILDIIAADTTTDIPALIATAQADLDTITGADGVTLATAQGLYAPNTVVPDAAGVAPTAVEIRQEMDSNSVQLNTTLPGLIDDLAIKKNTAFSNFEFLMVLTSDHVTPATGLTVTGQRSINGGAFASVSGAIAEVSNGIYQFDALAADTNGDVITWRFLSATADDAFITFKTVA